MKDSAFAAAEAALKSRFLKISKTGAIEERIKTEVELKTRASIKIGGPARLFIFAKTEQEFVNSIEICQNYDVKFEVIGRGSNILPPSEGLNKAVICADIKKIDLENDGKIIAGAGASLSGLAESARKNGLSGLEFAKGIPGGVGGAIYMNAGAFGGEISDICREIKIFDGEKISVIPASQAKFGYRDSIFRSKTLKKSYILGAVFELSKCKPDLITQTMNEYAARRKATQPLERPSAGSAFKRPPGNFAAKLIEEAGLKGARIGGAQFSDKHAGFIINLGGATSDDVKRLTERAQTEVKIKFGIELEPEICFL